MSLRLPGRHLVILISAILFCPIAAGEHVYAVWVWEEASFRFLDEPEWREDVLTQLARDGINTLYLYADVWKQINLIGDEPELYREAISGAHARGFRVEALLGSAYLGTNRYVMPDKRDDARAMIERIIAYNDASSPNERFDAIHLDIEPYTIPEWDRDKEGVVEHFVDAAREWRRIAHRDGSRLEIGAAIPFWFDRVKRGNSNLGVALLEAFDYVALMDYRDHADGNDGIIKHARYEVSAAERLGRKVVVGVETNGSDLDKLTFAEEGKGILVRELEKVREAFRGEPGYGGIAIHHLDSYLSMKR